jgi:hypothetical protein
MTSIGLFSKRNVMAYPTRYVHFENCCYRVRQLQHNLRYLAEARLVHKESDGVRDCFDRELEKEQGILFCATQPNPDFHPGSATTNVVQQFS